MNIDSTRADYYKQKPLADSFLQEFIHQFAPLVGRANVALGVPLESRVKDWASLEDKLRKNALDIERCRDLHDFIGVRAIALFRRDVDTLCDLIEKVFPILHKEDKQQILKASHFGYLSRHFVVTIPETWKSMPSFRDLDFRVEIQVRTLAQHIWAASSHLLQYKKESDVPPLVSRSIYRVAALLETVDLEFERVLEEREKYAVSDTALADDSLLDVDNLRLLLQSELPKANEIGPASSYGEILGDLRRFKILSVGRLKTILSKHYAAIIASDKEQAALERAEKKSAQKARTGKDTFFTLVGLARVALREELGKPYDDFLRNRSDWEREMKAK